MGALTRARSPARSVLVVGGSPEHAPDALLRRLAGACDLVIACDSGADWCVDAGVRVDELVGDDDSLRLDTLRRVLDQGVRRHLYPMDKDEVDLALALDRAREVLGRAGEGGHDPAGSAGGVVLTGVSGARPDHALAAFGTIARNADLGCAIEERDYSCRVISPTGPRAWVAREGDLGRTLSVVPVLGSCVVSERGMRWDVDRATIGPLSDRGVSNVVERLPAQVEVHEGVALVFVLRERISKRTADEALDRPAR
jgi:thiamine pyrophosphokinase